VFTPQGAQAATITVNYVGSWDTAARTAFQHAVNIWAAQVNSAVPIVVEAHWADLGEGILGGAAAYGYYRDFTNAPIAETWYNIALANALSGQDLNNSDGRDSDGDGSDADPEIYAQFNSSFSHWYFGIDGNPGSNYDFTTVVLHELTHGLGFAGSMTVLSNGLGSWGWGQSPYPAAYDHFIQNGAGQPILSFPDMSVQMAAQLQSNDLYFNGANANGANGGQRPKIFAPASWMQGSSYSHFDEIFNGTTEALMTYSLDPGEATHDPGNLVRGVFRDLGWTITYQDALPDLTLGMELLSDPAPAPGDAVSVQIKLSNAGAATATGVVISMDVPTSIQPTTWSASASLAGTSVRSGTNYVWDLPDVESGASGTITVQGTVDTGLPSNFFIVTDAVVSTTDQESDDTNNRGAVAIGGIKNYLPLALR
jgi:uncharacterized repeat protein (TIGR01451 family)